MIVVTVSCDNCGYEEHGEYVQSSDIYDFECLECGEEYCYYCLVSEIECDGCALSMCEQCFEEHELNCQEGEEEENG